MKVQRVPLSGQISTWPENYCISLIKLMKLFLPCPLPRCFMPMTGEAGGGVWAPFAFREQPESASPEMKTPVVAPAPVWAGAP